MHEPNTPYRHTSNSIREELSELADPAYRAFQAKLLPTVSPERILGVRTPALRRHAKKLAAERPSVARAFMETPLHPFYDEMNLHAELIGLLCATPDEAFRALDRFLPFVDNWATCDLIRVPAFSRDLPATLGKIRQWMASEPEYQVRFAVVQLMNLFLGEAFEPEHLDLVAAIERPEYYINMARAWYLSFAIIRKPEATMPLFENAGTQPLADARLNAAAAPGIGARLDAWTRNKALQKARESLRMSAPEREHLQALKAPHRLARPQLIVRDVRDADYDAIARLMFDTVHRVNARDYSQAEIQAWVGDAPDPGALRHRLAGSYCQVAEAGGRIVGFGNIDVNGVLDHLFVHADHQGEGVGGALCRRLEPHAATAAATAITVHASLTARPFFERRGYRIVREEHVERAGTTLTRYLMAR